MSTRSIVAAETEKGIIGVYVHCDGYPEGRLPVLRALAARDGLAKVVHTIVGKPNGWSCLDEDQPAEDENIRLGAPDRFATVVGYGIEYTTVEGQADTEYWTPNSDPEANWAIAFFYIIRTNGTVDWAENGGGPYASFTWTNETLVS